MVFIKGGTFQMGLRGEQKSVTVSDFYIGKYEVTNNEYCEYDPEHENLWPNPNDPVSGVNWYDAIEYCNWLSDREGLERCYSGRRYNITLDISKHGYRLPMEAEWEMPAVLVLLQIITGERI